MLLILNDNIWDHMCTLSSGSVYREDADNEFSMCIASQLVIHAGKKITAFYSNVCSLTEYDIKLRFDELLNLAAYLDCSGGFFSRPSSQ